MLLLLALLPCACSRGGGDVMIPAPILAQDERLDLTRAIAERDRGTTVEVLWATNRAPAADGDPANFASTPGDGALLGSAAVRLGEPDWTFDDLVASDRTSRAEDDPRPAQVVSLESFGKLGDAAADDAFVAAIDERVSRSRSGEAVLYVPGYRVSFNRTLTFMGGWAHYLGRSSAVMTFAWPTGTRVWSYLTDCPRARAFVPDIERLITLVAERSKAKRLNVIAFSCGSPLLADALVALRERHPEDDADALQRRYRIANAIFVAADIDLATFARAQLPALTTIARRTEVYLSEDDVALKAAAFLARASRLGRPRFDELTREDLETLVGNDRLVGIDVAGVYGRHETTGMRGHGYWFANQRVSSDVLLSMVYPFDPAWRGLVHGPGKGLWTFPDDYPERVGRAVYDAAPELRREPAVARP
ncbi:MAG: alpha/beta hydrolase [Candidatus Binatia bacterium]